MADTVVGLIEQANINNNIYNIASTAYAECSTGASIAIKEIALPGFSYKPGVTIHVRFTNKHDSNTAPKLKINSTEEEIPIMLYGTTAAGKAEETSGWQAGAVLSLTYVEVDSTHKYWYRDQGYNTNTTYTFDGTYNSSTNKVATVSTVTNAINALDVDNATSGNGNHITGFAKSKTLASLTETNGIIAASFQDIEIAASKITSGILGVARGGTGAETFTSGQVLIGNGTSAVTTKAIDTTVTTNSSNLITSGAVASAISGLTGAMHFIGVATVEITDGGTENPTINNYNFGTNGANATKGDVVLYNNKEFVWTGSAWEELGAEGSHALDTAVVHKSDYSALGVILYGTGSGAYAALLGNTANTEKVLMMKGTGSAAANPEWTTLGINPSKTKAVTAVAYTSGTSSSGTGTWPTLSTGAAFSVPNVTDAGSAATAQVTDAVLIITNGVAPTIAETNFSIPNVTGINTTNAKWPALSVTKNTDFLTGASITYN